MFASKAARGVSAFISIAVSILFIVGGILFFVKFDPDAYDCSTTATITRIEEEYNITDEQYDYHVFVKYTVDGNEYETEYGSYHSGMHEGDEVELWYMSSDPMNITSGNKDLAPFIGLGFAALGLILLVVDVIKFLRRR